MAEITLKAKKMSASGVVCAEECFYGGFVLGTDGVNNPTITIYDNAAAASGTELTPTAEYDATLLGLNGHEKGKVTIANNGIYFEMNAGGGAHEATVYYRETSDIQNTLNIIGGVVL